MNRKRGRAGDREKRERTKLLLFLASTRPPARGSQNRGSAGFADGGVIC